MAGRKVIVTGAAGALGRAVFEHFEAAGDKLVALDVNDGLLAEAFNGRGDHSTLPST